MPVLTENIEKSKDLVDDGVAFTQTAREFHDLVVSFTPNATVRYVVSSLVALWSAQEEAWAEALTGRGEYPSREQARAAVRTHQKIVDDIASGQASAAEHMACAHLAATQALLLDRFDDGIVNASSTMAQQAIRGAQSLRR